MTTTLAIRTEDLTKQFVGGASPLENRHFAVQGVKLEVAAGEVYGLIGPNGAGKTTLLRMLATAEEPTEGEIYINGERLIRDRSNADLKRSLGYLPDDFPLYDDLTVWDYLDYFARLYKLPINRRQQRLGDVLELVELTVKRDSRISTLSRGMKQRLSLARSIIHEPALLLLDEPVSGLDPIARMQFRQIIKTLQASGMTILISSHVLSDLAELCTSVGIMELGLLIESCKLQDLYQRLSQQQILITTLGDLAALKSALKGHTLVTKIEAIIGINQVRVGFDGTEADAAELLRSLIHAEIPINNFQCIQEDLETIFLKLGHNRTS
jgi:ABC-2 type transport system ATP-binding protein